MTTLNGKSYIWGQIVSDSFAIGVLSILLCLYCQLFLTKHCLVNSRRTPTQSTDADTGDTTAEDKKLILNGNGSDRSATNTVKSNTNTETPIEKPKKTLKFQNIKWDIKFIAGVCTIFTLVSYIVTPLFDLIERGVELHSGKAMNCKLFFQIGSMLYQTSKASIYTVLVLRLQIAYQRTPFGYSNRVIYSLRIALVLFYLGSICEAIWAANGTYDDGSCRADFELWGIAYIVLCDLIFVLLTLILFNRPLRKLSHSQSNATLNTNTPPRDTAIVMPKIVGLDYGDDVDNNGDNNGDNSGEISPIIERKASNKHRSVKPMHDDNDLRNLAVKYTVLSSMAVLSELLFMICVFGLQWEFASGINIVTNVACLLLMHSEYKDVYAKLCCGADRCWRRCC